MMRWIRFFFSFLLNAILPFFCCSFLRCFFIFQIWSILNPFFFFNLWWFLLLFFLKYHNQYFIGIFFKFKYLHNITFSLHNVSKCQSIELIFFFLNCHMVSKKSTNFQFEFPKSAKKIGGRHLLGDITVSLHYIVIK